MRVLANANARGVRRGWRGTLPKEAELIFTRDEAHARHAVDEAVARGVHVLGVLGGDGTLHGVLQHLARHPEPRPALLPIPAGTINFVAHHLGSLASIHEVPAGRKALPTLRLTTRLGSRTSERIGFAAALAGIGAEFLHVYRDEPDPRPASIAEVALRAVLGLPFGGATARRLFASHPMRVELDGRPWPGTAISALHVGSIPITLGGLVRAFPQASVEGFHAHVGTLRPADVLARVPQIVTGRSLTSEAFFDGPARALCVVSLGSPLHPVIDGEPCDAAESVEVTLGPRITFATP